MCALCESYIFVRYRNITPFTIQGGTQGGHCPICGKAGAASAGLLPPDEKLDPAIKESKKQTEAKSKILIQPPLSYFKA